MLEKAIESWLTNANELTYQHAFIQTLMLEGHRVIKISPHGPGEHGKDVITEAPDGVLCAYQLKGGSISLGKWRDIRGETEDLCRIPVEYPGIKKDRRFRPYLVTNGTIANDVLTQMRQLCGRPFARAASKGLEAIELPNLLSRLTTFASTSLPEDSFDRLQDFLKFFSSPGRNQLAKPEFAKFLDAVSHPRRETNAEWRRKLCELHLVATFAMKPYSVAKHWVAQAEALTIAAATIERKVIENALPEPCEPRDLVLSALSFVLKQLTDEFLSRESFWEGDKFWDGGQVYRARVTVALGWICAHCLANDVGAEVRARVAKRILALRGEFAFWGDSAVPFWFSIITFMSAMRNAFWAESRLEDVFRLVVSSTRSSMCFPPYFDYHAALDLAYGVATPDLLQSARDSSKSSFSLLPIVEMLCRRGDRLALERLWKEASVLGLRYFRLRSLTDYWSWTSEQGRNETLNFGAPQSWRELCELARKPVKLFRKFPESKLRLLHFWSIAAPHRCSVGALRTLDLHYERRGALVE